MQRRILFSLGTSILLLAALAARAEVKTVVDHNEGDQINPEFKFKNVPAPSKTDAATNARFTVVYGKEDKNSNNVDKLHDGGLPTKEDDPKENFFFNEGTEGGRIGVDFGAAI